MQGIPRSLTRMALVTAVICAAADVLAGDVGREVEFTDTERQAIFSLSAYDPPPPDPTNRFANDLRAVEFGRTLFFDPRMSRNGRVSCASCHDPKKAWTDGKRVAVGLSVGARKTPTIANVAYYRWFFRDGRAATLWQQALQPIQDPREMGQSRAGVLQLLQQNPSLGRTYEQIFGPLPGPDTTCAALDRRGVDCSDPADTTAVNVAKSLAAFMRTLVYRCSPFDRFADGLRRDELSKQAAISDDAKRGLHVFLGGGRCVSCHHGPILSELGVPRCSRPELAGSVPRRSWSLRWHPKTA